MKKKIYKKLIASKIFRFLPLKTQRSIIKKSKITFIPSNITSLPTNNYKNPFSFEFHEEKYQNFLISNKVNSFCSGYSLLLILSVLYKKTEEFNFLDFGGENIDQFLFFNKNFTKINYFIVNQQKINDDLLKIKKKYNLNNLQIINQNEAINRKFDFIFFGSVIQYLHNWDLIINRFLNQKPFYVYISALSNYLDSSNLSNKDFIVKQINTFPDINYLYFINKNFLKNVFVKSNYELVCEYENISDRIDYSNFSPKFIINYSDFLFKKVPNP